MSLSWVFSIKIEALDCPKVVLLVFKQDFGLVWFNIAKWLIKKIVIYTCVCVCVLVILILISWFLENFCHLCDYTNDKVWQQT